MAEETNDRIELRQILLAMSEQSRYDGLLSLEDDLEQVNDPFLRKVLRLVTDGTDPEIVGALLENELETFRQDALPKN